nr:hypothetical protein [Acidobacteriota bacterium]NIM62449.1 hypothetical protein [Acidobacteriota bacterium]NIO59880.1 hypothetical protein [Acidobacteriota bacterium]NIQ30962.1 hypothetical protein [Acidobacteriota bacterium]NIQ86043.1 hypothetical protein [Acidobacteriota bacterium]
MQRSRCLVGLLSTLLFWTAAAHADIEDYRAIRDLRTDGRVVRVSDFTMTRDVFELTFDGAFHLLGDVNGRTVGAVFLGDGSLSYTPLDPREQQHLQVLARREGTTGFSDTFKKAMFLFADSTGEELLAAGELATGAPSGEAQGFRENCLKRQRRDLHTNFSLRVYQDLMNVSETKPRVFLGFINFDESPHSLVAVDPLGADGLWVGENAGFGVDGPEESALVFMDPTNRGFIYLSHTRDEIESRKHFLCKRKHLVDAQHYSISTTIKPNREVVGETTITFKPKQSGLRVVPLRLMLPLRIQSVESVDGAGTVEFIQEEPPTDVGSLAVEGADAALVFSEPLKRGQEVTVRVRYAGDEVLEDAGDENYYVGTRTSWYPNVGVFSDWATYDLEFFIPDDRNIVSIGEHLGDGVSEGRNVSRWRAETPVPVAGFNYGRFKAMEQPEAVSGTRVQVYTNPGTPDIVHAINAFLQVQGRGEQSRFATDVTGGDAGYEGYVPGMNTATQNFKTSTEALAQNAMADGVNAIKLFHTLFGPQPHKRIAVTQQTNWAFGQSWPTLIYLPYTAFINATDRAKLYDARAMQDATMFVDSVGIHEMAHQWWGNLVGWESYRDQWLSEGLASFSTAIALETIEGQGRANEFWKHMQDRLTEPGHGAGSMRPYEVGPVTQGVRLITRRSPNAYQYVVYNKGAMILQTLRMLMRDTNAQVPDAAFFAMLKDFATSYAGKNVTTREFQRHVQKHMVAGLNARGDGKVDWFFDQWVHGTEMPRYVVDVEITKSGKNYRFLGEVRQENVSDDFMAMVPFYVDYGKGAYGMLGKAPFIGNQT